MRNSVAERRKALGLTQTELALASQLSRPLISAVETGRHVPSVKAAIAIAGCEPGLGLAASLLPGSGPQRLVAIPASSADAMDALNAGRIHAAVVHGRPGHLRRTSGSVRRFALAGWRVGLASRVGLPSG